MRGQVEQNERLRTENVEMAEVRGRVGELREQNERLHTENECLHEHLRTENVEMAEVRDVLKSCVRCDPYLDV